MRDFIPWQRNKKKKGNETKTKKTNRRNVRNKKNGDKNSGRCNSRLSLVPPASQRCTNNSKSDHDFPLLRSISHPKTLTLLLYSFILCPPPPPLFFSLSRKRATMRKRFLLLGISNVFFYCFRSRSVCLVCSSFISNCWNRSHKYKFIRTRVPMNC